MKKIISVSICMFTCFVCLSQSYLGSVTKQVNFRTGPNTSSGIISSLYPGTQIFIISLETENDFYNTIDIATNKEGYIHKSYVKVGKKVEENESGVFTPSGSSGSSKPEIEVYNNTSLTLTIKLNSEVFYFKPQERRTLDIYSGNCSYRASAPGVIPYIGNESIVHNMNYSWEFYIVTKYR